MELEDIIIPKDVNSVKINNEKLKNINFIKKYDKEWDELNFSYNDFKELKIISGIICNKLILSNNDIKEITLFGCNIKCLEMEKCNINKIHFIDTSIEKLIINTNDIEELNLFPNNLKHLEIKNNNLSYFHYNELLSGLEILYLDNNNVENFVFNKNNNLIKLSLNNNSLSSFEFDIITQKLELLNLLNNNFDTCNHENKNIRFITKKYTNLKIFIEFYDNNLNDTNNSSDDDIFEDIIPKHKMKIFNDSDDNDDNGDDKSNDDSNFNIDDDINDYFNNDSYDDCSGDTLDTDDTDTSKKNNNGTNINKFNIKEMDKNNEICVYKNNIKNKVEFRWNILI